LIKDDNIIYSDTNDYNIISKIQLKCGSKNLIVDNNLLDEARQIKDPGEIENIKKASIIIDKLFQIATDEIKENISEEQIQSILVYEALKLGARFPNYAYTTNPLIVASGNNASYPHAETSDKKINSGELIVIDITLCYNHYVSDATRTFALGNIPQNVKQVYEIVKFSQEKGIEDIKNAINFSEIDASCRNAIIDNKLGDYFTHSTGHGIGLEVHESPWIRPNFNSEIKENMTITIEPGIYIENKFGVRIEDSLLIIKDKNHSNENVKFDYQNFHTFRKDLLVL
jgi:Xaa-Pro aminopeptidase/Xaa-Pro dipeptidase